MLGVKPHRHEFATYDHVPFRLRSWNLRRLLCGGGRGRRGRGTEGGIYVKKKKKEKVNGDRDG